MARTNRWMASVATMMLLAACSGSSDQPASSGSEAVASCNKVCEKQGEKACSGPIMVSVDDCKQLCAGIVSVASPACQAQIKSESDCQLMQPDICTSEDACKTKADAGAACM
jgi:hypothetical protein